MQEPLPAKLINADPEVKASWRRFAKRCSSPLARRVMLNEFLRSQGEKTP